MMIEEANGCAKTDDQVRYEIDNVKFHTCFCNFKHPYFNILYKLYLAYEKGMLPFQGSLLDQPSYIIDAFSIINTLQIEKQNELIEKNNGK